MTTLRFTKGHGTENDFVLVFDEHADLDLTPELVRFLCDRRAGIGGDGVIRAVRAGALPSNELPAGTHIHADTWFMDYWNADGSIAEMCGNGARVFAAFLEQEASTDISQGLTIGTRAGERTVTAFGNGVYAVEMGDVRTGTSADGFDAEVEARGLTPARPALSVNVGNPHHVVALASLAELEALDLSTAPRVTPAPTHGTNVEFVVARGGTQHN